VDLIVDASVAYKWLVADDDSYAALALRRDHEVVAPDLLMIECRNAALNNFRKGTLSLEEALSIDHDLERLSLPTLPSVSFVTNAFSIALALRHPIYDCIYVAAAIAANRILVTADRRFAAKVSAAGIANARIELLGAFSTSQ
jgi:predicted nucleic acid-binding protein